MLRGILPLAILQYIIDKELQVGNGSEPRRLPPLSDISGELDISLGKLREELITARAYGVVDLRPGDGTYVRPFEFYDAIRTVILYSIASDWRNFDCLYALRTQLEIGFWDEAARRLSQEDQKGLFDILQRAERKLASTPVEIPNREHRDFHLHVFKKLDNQFVRSLLRVYWDAYEAAGMHRYFDYGYYETMWTSHRTIAEAIAAGQYDTGHRALSKHFTLLENRIQGGPGKP